MEEVVTESPEINTVENDSLQNREILALKIKETFEAYRFFLVEESESLHWDYFQDFKNQFFDLSEESMLSFIYEVSRIRDEQLNAAYNTINTKIDFSKDKSPSRHIKPKEIKDQSDKKEGIRQIHLRQPKTPINKNNLQFDKSPGKEDVKRDKTTQSTDNVIRRGIKNKQDESKEIKNSKYAASRSPNNLKIVKRVEIDAKEPAKDKEKKDPKIKNPNIKTKPVSAIQYPNTPNKIVLKNGKDVNHLRNSQKKNSDKLNEQDKAKLKSVEVNINFESEMKNSKTDDTPVDDKKEFITDVINEEICGNIEEKNEEIEAKESYLNENLNNEEPAGNDIVSSTKQDDEEY